MKFDELRSIAHNLADSLASGCSLLAGLYDCYGIFVEARESPEGFIEVNLIDGSVSAGACSPKMAQNIKLIAQAFPKLCVRHGTTPEAFRRLSVKFFGDLSGRYAVEIEDRTGRAAIDEYFGNPGRRKKVTDSIGRVRTQRGRLENRNVS